MDHKTFGKLVAALRRAQFNEDGERFTQAMLADKARELDPSTPLTDLLIGKIERGERAILDRAVLLSLIAALDLTLGERQVFLQLASGLENADLYPIRGDATAILETATRRVAELQLPALLLDQYLDVIAVNALVLPFYQVSILDLQKRAGEPAAFNLLSLIFSDGFAHMREQMPRQQWHAFAVGNVIYFRRTTMPYRMTAYFQYLFERLWRSRDFRWFWEQVHYEDHLSFVGGEVFEMGDAVGGALRFLTAPLVQLTPFGNLEIITHIPRNEATADYVHALRQDRPSTVYPLASWPHKTIPAPV
ncbi:MAG: hypothetical protein KDD84_24190, partial [Caldilineaceae bacterium]|nr:hypothetical protein [Caldilineaceae bacterium]